MALAQTLLQDPQNALTALLSQGIGALNAAVNHSINVGRDRATTQLNQENTVFDVLKNQRDLELRKASELRRNMESDRLFDRTVKRDVRADFTDDRGFYRDIFNQDRQFGLQTEAAKRADAAAARTSQHYTTTEGQAATRLEMDAIRLHETLRTRQEEERQTDLLRTRTEDQRAQALGSTTADALSDPLSARTLTTPDLEGYVDIFSPVEKSDPRVQARTDIARRELRRRNPEIDPDTGAKIPDRFSPDKKRAAISRMPRQDQLVNAASLHRFITDAQTKANDPTQPKALRGTAYRELADALEELAFFPADVQEEAKNIPLPDADPSSGDPMAGFR